jgi:hypothetical protein
MVTGALLLAGCASPVVPSGNERQALAETVLQGEAS